MTRRQFLVTGGATLAAAAFRGPARMSGQEPPRRVGLIGCGWYGKTDLYALTQVAPVDVVALCDVDTRMLAEAAARVAGWHATRRTPRPYRDYRQMLAEHQCDIVLVGTPDHWHALPVIAAVQAGADVYCQKPLSVDIVEGQAMVAAARTHQRVVQVGTQRRSAPHLVEARETILQAGKLGQIGHVEICCYGAFRHRGQVAATIPPSYLDYDLWTGPAPWRPYTPLVHPQRWRMFMEYGNGIIGDLGVHMLDLVRWLLDLGWPERISAAGGIRVDRASTANIADTQTATFEFSDCTVVWTHRTWGTPPDPQYPWAAFLYGEKGTLKVSTDRWDFLPQGSSTPMHGELVTEFDRFPQDAQEKELDPPMAAVNRRHQQAFLRAIAARDRPVADIEQGHISSASCILANLAMHLGRTLTWNPATHQVVADDEANRLLRRPYRAPWVHPEPDRV